jgi:hypothetical protein
VWQVGTVVSEHIAFIFKWTLNKEAISFSTVVPTCQTLLHCHNPECHSMPWKLQVIYIDPVQLVVKGSGHGMLSWLYCMNFLCERMLHKNKMLLTPWSLKIHTFVKVKLLCIYQVVDASNFLDSVYLYVFKFFSLEQIFSHTLNFFQLPLVWTVPAKTALGKGWLFFSGLIDKGNPT